MPLWGLRGGGSRKVQISGRGVKRRGYVGRGPRGMTSYALKKKKKARGGRG